ncbi:MAG: hypothetical protein GXY48_07455 [Methanomicrobiales archaeon]|nr:hypothetical protein [Methanomicrobiales archaeon]
MATRNHTILIVDVVYAIIALICGSLFLSSLVRFSVYSIQSGQAASWTWVWAGVMALLLIITIFSFRRIDHSPIRMLVIIGLFVPQIVNLLLDQTIPFPEVWFLNT